MASLLAARRDALSELLQDWTPQQHDELAGLLTRLARHVKDEPVPAASSTI